MGCTRTNLECPRRSCNVRKRKIFDDASLDKYKAEITEGGKWIRTFHLFFSFLFFSFLLVDHLLMSPSQVTQYVDAFLSLCIKTKKCYKPSLTSGIRVTVRGLLTMFSPTQMCTSAFREAFLRSHTAIHYGTSWPRMMYNRMLEFHDSGELSLLSQLQKN